jgi:hypothetical protein
MVNAGVEDGRRGAANQGGGSLDAGFHGFRASEEGIHRGEEVAAVD